MSAIFRFVIDWLAYVVKGGPKFYALIAGLSALVLPMIYGTYLQTTEGLSITGLTSQVSDGLYIANFIFLVGVAAAAVTIVFPAYAYHHKGLHEVALLGKMVAAAAVVMCLLFIVSHMGRPERVWHMMPLLGIYNIPGSMLAWDMLVLSVYFALNILGGFYFMYMRYIDAQINRKFYMTLIYVTIVWALSIHIVTAFFLSTMPARPMWHTGLMPIRFIVTAFAAGPSLIILILLMIRNHTRLRIDNSAIDTLATIITYCMGIAVFLTLSEIVVALYAPTEHSAGLQYLMFGANGLNDLVPWFWSSLAMNLIAFGMLLTPGVRKNYRLLAVACVLSFIGIWIEKGVGLVVPGYIPSPIGEFTRYVPSTLELLVTLGNWALGLLVLTILLKGAIGILLGDIKYRSHGSSAGCKIKGGGSVPSITSR